MQKPHPYRLYGGRSESRALIDQGAFAASARSADEEEAAGLAELVGDELAGTRVVAHAYTFHQWTRGCPMQNGVAGEGARDMSGETGDSRREGELGHD